MLAWLLAAPPALARIEAVMKGGQATSVTAPAAAPAAANPLRLPSDVRPLAVALSLTIDPAQSGHSGEVLIDLQLANGRSQLQLHGQDLRLHSASALVAGRERPARQLPQGPTGRITLAFDPPLPAGPVRLRLAFSGRMQEQTFYGLFRQREAGQWSAFSHFQPSGARRVFPLFDEPGWRLPWTLSLTVPEPLTALSNMPMVRQTSHRAGWKTWHFEPTPALPSYLLAFAVGRFDAHAAPAVGKLAQRIFTPVGRAADAAPAAAATAQLLDRLQAYFGQPYPYAKLDSLAVPVSAGFAAMEHPGLITYASYLLLAPPAPVPPRWRSDLLATVAHELAHQWFGNLVSPAWWDDLWLNESFASWLGDKTSAELQPDTAPGNLVRARSAAMQADLLPSARHIEQAVTSDEALASLWDPIAYEKGQLLIGMAEAWVGPERFRDAVRRYIRQHAQASARSEDFFAALAATDPSLPALLRSFTRQPGVPLLRVDLRCGDGPPQLVLTQSPLRPAGASAAARQWQLPLLLRSPAGTSRLVMREAQASLALPDKACPAWVQANVGGLGYYRVAYPAPLLAALAAQPMLPLVEALVLLDDARSLHALGLLGEAPLLALAQRFAGQPQPQPELLLSAAETLLQLQPFQPAPDHARLWQTSFGQQANELGWLTRPGDSDAVQALRARLLPLMADAGGNATLRNQARQLAQAWLLDRGQLDAAMRRPVLNASALDTDSAWFESLLSALRASNDRSEQQDLLSALGHVRAPALAERARQRVLAPGQDIRAAVPTLLAAQAGHGATLGDALTFIGRHQAMLVKALAPDEIAALPGLFATACSVPQALQINSALAPVVKGFPGGGLALTRVLEHVALCMAGRPAQRQKN